MTDESKAVPTTYNINVPADVAEGHYADFASVWHNAETFILDFSAMTRPPRLVTDESGQQVRQVESQTVTRVRIPASQVWEVMKALESQLSQWEAARKGGSKPA